MHKELLDKIESKEELLILTDENGNIIFKTNKSPVSSFYRAFYKNQIQGTGFIVYSNQLGLAMALAARKLNITEFNACEISEPAIELISSASIKLNYTTAIDLVKSSKDNTQVCPIEQDLYDIKDINDRLKYIDNKFKK